MEKAVFEFSDYKAYLREFAGVGQRRGLRLKLAAAAQCQPTYVSLVLNGDSDFSLEQAELVSEFLGHSKEERHYFLLLVQKGRAGTRMLEAYFQEQLDAIRKQRMNVQHRLGAAHTMTDVEQARYYSSWIYVAVHIALSIPELQDRQRLSRFLQVPVAKVSEVIEFLLRCGLLVEENGHYVFGPTQIRLGSDSPQVIKHHTNWRTRAVESLERETDRDLHYSGVYSIARADAYRIKDQLLEDVKRCQKAMRASGTEELYCFNLDFFSLKVDVGE
jgi:uncharacterized protein (TIGR02147 family)